jgi:hypothetical protein
VTDFVAACAGTKSDAATVANVAAIAKIARRRLFVNILPP